MCKMAYQTLYLRWRPSSFETLVGQAPVKQALMNSLTSGRIAHAYLFTGPRGTGKTTTARIFAKALNCVNGPTDRPCGECLNCRQITDGSALDVQELDAASNRGVDDIKNLNKNADFAPVNCRYKVYIIDEAHMLTTEACNALLKTLEEPPDHVVFILATTEPQKILPTIHSRCQRFDFHPITQEEIVAHLQKVAEGSDIKAEKEALELIAAASEGGMRDALSLLEQCGVMAETVTAEVVRSVRGIIGREILRELVYAVGQRKVSDALLIFDKLLMQGKDISQILIELSGYMRALLLYKATPEYQPIYVTDTAEELGKLAPLYSGERILAAQQIIHEAMSELRFTARGRITAEMCLYDLCREDNRTLKVLAARINRLEQELEAIKTQGTAVTAVSADTVVAHRPVSQATPVPQRKDGPAESAVAQELTVKGEPAEAAKKATTVSEAPKAAPAKTEAPAAATEASKAETPGIMLPEPQPIPIVKPEPKPATPSKTETKQSPASVGPGSAATEKPEPVSPEPDASVSAYTPYGGEWAEGDAFWAKAMERLKAERKNSIASCASHGSVIAYENKVLTVGFKMKFLCDRLQKPDYREVVEEVLLRVARVPIRLQCVVDAGGGTPAGVPAVKTRPAAAKPAPAAPDFPVSESTKKAMEMFGGTIHKV